MTDQLSRARGPRVRLAAVAMLLVGLLALAGGAARSVSAATSTISITVTQTGGVTSVTRSTADQKTNVTYAVTFTSQQTWTHVTLSDSGLTGDAKVVFTNCPGWIATTGGFSCDVGNLAGKTSDTFTVVVQTPTSGGTLTVNPTVTGKEIGNDQNSGHTDSFPATLSWSLISDQPDALNSFTNPTPKTDKASFFTKKDLCTTTATCTPASANKQWTQADIPNGLAPLGVLVSLTERELRQGECPSFVIAANQSCFGQVSEIGVGSSGPGGVFSCAPPKDYPTSCSHSLVFTIRLAAAVVAAEKVNAKKAYLIHDAGNGYEKVPFCSTGLKDSSGDCTQTIFLDVNGDLVSIVEGPGNGSWGGA